MLIQHMCLLRESGQVRHSQITGWAGATERGTRDEGVVFLDFGVNLCHLACRRMQAATWPVALPRTQRGRRSRRAPAIHAKPCSSSEAGDNLRARLAGASWTKERSWAYLRVLSPSRSQRKNPSQTCRARQRRPHFVFYPGVNPHSPAGAQLCPKESDGAAGPNGGTEPFMRPRTLVHAAGIPPSPPAVSRGLASSARHLPSSGNGARGPTPDAPSPAHKACAAPDGVRDGATP